MGFTVRRSPIVRHAAVVAAVVAALFISPTAALAAATFSEWNPSPGSTQTVGGSADPLQVRATTIGGVTISSSTSRLYLDGSPTSLSLAFFPSTTSGLLRSNFAPPDGPHTLRATVTDSGGALSETTWGFTTAIPPRVYFPTPANGETVGVARPPIGFFYSDNSGAAQVSVRIRLDGTEVFNGPTGGTFPFYWYPTTDLANDASHSVIVDATDAAGNTSTISWSFYVLARPAMDTPACEECHTTYLGGGDHSTDNCDACHPGLIDVGPIDYDYSHGAVGYIGIFECTDCHNPSNSGVPQHDPAALPSLHASTTTGCDSCHDMDLIDEHAKYPTGTEFKYQCTVCHTSTDSQVQDAIAAPDTACLACHTLAPGHGDLVATHAGIPVEPCVDCHGSDVVALHPDCETCHNPTAPSGATCITCHPTMVVDHGAGPFKFPYNTNYYGYLSWTYAQSISTGDASSPHGNYTTSTYKCAVCHSVHKAKVGGKALTAWPGVTSSTNMAPYESCMWCHGTSSPLFANSRIAVSTELSPHGYCGRCHARSVHGADGSVYPVLKARMINTNGDGAIAAELSAGTNNIAAVDFGDASDAGALTLGTGYLCGSCHSGALALPVNESGATPFQSASTRTTVTGHRVQAMVTGDWNDDGSYGAYYSSGYTGSAVFGGPIAFNPVAATTSGCKSCHDAVMPDGTVAFPHSYIDAAGAPVLKTDLGSSYIWLTTAGDADDARVVSGKTVTGNADTRAGTVDGLCLKCHLSGDRSSGVGATF